MNNNRFGFFQTSEGSDALFSSLITLDSFLQQCRDIFGLSHLSPNVSATNDFYGGWNIRTNNTFFSNGLIDPWHYLGLGVNQPSSTMGKGQNYIRVMNTTAHCADLYPSNKRDPKELTDTRKMQIQAIQQWLAG